MQVLNTFVPKLLCCHVALVSSQCFLHFEILSLLRSFLPHFASLYVFFITFVIYKLLFRTYTEACFMILFHVLHFTLQRLSRIVTPLLQFSLYCLSTVFSFFSSLKLSAWNSSTHFIAHVMVWHCKWNGQCKLATYY